MVSSELVSMCRSYLDKKITLQQLEEWLVPLLPSFARQPTSSDADLSAIVAHGLAETSDGVTSEREFRDELEDALGKEVLVLTWILGQASTRSFNVMSGSSNQEVPTPKNTSPSMSGELPEVYNLSFTLAGAGAQSV